MNFLKQVAEYVREQSLPLEHLTVILPSERAGRYFASELFEVYGQPVFSPGITTMDRWVKQHTPLAVMHRTRCLLELFEIQLGDLRAEEDRSFEAFSSWGMMLLSDFDEIDRYLVNPDHIFRNLRDIRELEQWNLGEEEMTESQKRFLEFWERLPRYYRALNERLEAKGACYAGRAFRYVAEHPDVFFREDKQRTFVFAGFNALSASELAVMKQLYNMGRAHILVDGDHWYVDNKQHEAGRFLRDLSTALDGKRLNFIRDELSAKSLECTLIECTQRTGQAKVAASLLAGMGKDELDSTLLLLADESLIDTVIRNLPATIGKANITLGLPVRNTAVRTWEDLLFGIQENKRRFHTQAIYFSDLQQFWNHPLVLAVTSSEEQQQTGQEERKMIERNRIFLNPERLELGEITRRLLKEVTVDWQQDFKLAVQQIRRLNRMLYRLLGEQFAFERAALQGFDEAVAEFEDLVHEGLPEMSMRSFRQLFHQHWAQKSIAYHGNPMDGLQIMGLLETRALDFRQIICLGMNEGNLPPTNPMQTIIPMDLRKAFGLPSPREKQGLFAHHFYRLLHACEKLQVTSYTADEVIGNNEPSRYLLQLEMELARVNPKVTIEKKVYTLEEKRGSFEREIRKTPEILERLDTLFSQSASASMFKKYLTCPLDFYYRYVMEFGEEDGVEEEVEHSTFGTFIHATLEKLYGPFAQTDAEGNRKSPAPPPLRSVDVERMLKEYPVVMKQQFMEHFNGDQDAFMKGKNLLSYQMALELTGRFLRSEIAFLARQTEPVFIEALEQEYSSTVEVEVHGVPKQVRLRGYIDRIDRIGNQVRIIDYKSGKVGKDDVELRIKDRTPEDITDALGKRRHLLQLIQYAFLYHEKYGIYPDSCIISFVSGDNEPFVLNTRELERAEVIGNYPLYIAGILEQVYDSEQPFAHVPQQYSNCRYCD